jgi:hypothetical protein
MFGTQTSKRDDAGIRAFRSSLGSCHVNGVLGKQLLDVCTVSDLSFSSFSVGLRLGNVLLVCFDSMLS